MVRHIVVFKLKNRSEQGRNDAKTVLMGMDGKVPSIKRIEVRTDMLRSERSYDVYLAVDVANWESLREYQEDTYHCGVVKSYMAENGQSSVAIDFEI